MCALSTAPLAASARSSEEVAASSFCIDHGESAGVGRLREGLASCGSRGEPEVVAAAAVGADSNGWQIQTDPIGSYRIQTDPIGI